MLFFWLIPGIGLLCFIWGLMEAHMYRVKEHELPVLPKGSDSISILQVSDTHLRMSTKSLIRFLQSLSSQKVDVVLATGDLIGESEAVDKCAELLNAIAAPRRYFVLGSSDYYAPRIKNYLDYFLKNRKHSTKRNPTERLTGQLVDQGWIDLSNVNIIDTWRETSVQITGLDDPYLRREDRTLLKRQDGYELAVCVVHDPAPYMDAANAGYDLVISGHTHGGQVRFPFIGAVVTNSDIPTGLARWSHQIKNTWLFVSPGLGTGRYAPFRFMCRPEASLLKLVAKT